MYKNIIIMVYESLYKYCLNCNFQYTAYKATITLYGFFQGNTQTSNSFNGLMQIQMCSCGKKVETTKYFISN